MKNPMKPMEMADVLLAHGNGKNNPPLPKRNSRATSILHSFPKNAALNLDSNWRKEKSKPTSGPIDVIDMFCGCGGMSAGFRSVNALFPAYSLVGAFDIDQVANKSYTENFGISPIDIGVDKLAQDKNLLFSTISTLRKGSKKPLVLIGCAPCQGFSSHRNSNGELDPRNSLFFDFANIASTLQPAAVIIENVPEILTDRYWPLVQAARSILERSGYFVHVGVHNTAEFGVPQERFRALILAMKKPFSPPVGFLKRGDFKTVRDAIAFLPPILAGQRHPEDLMHYTAGHKDTTLATIRAVPKNGGSRPPDVGPACLRRGKEKNGRAVYEDVYGRLFWDRPAITITAYARNPASGRYVHPDQDRGLSVREAALLQSFPKTFSFSGSLDEKFRQIGNAVPPSFAAFIACHVFLQIRSGKTTSGFISGIEGPVGPSFSRLIPSLKAGYNSLT